MNPLRYVHSWPTVVIVAIVCATVFGALNVLEGDALAAVVSVLCVVGTTAAAVARQAFAVPPAAAPRRIELPRAPSSRRQENGDDDDSGEGGEVLAEEPPTKPLPRTPVRVTLSPRALLAMLPVLLLGCSPSALQTHATIASITGHVFDEACTEVEVARSREQHAIADGPLDREASTAAVEAVRAHWAPALASCELAADTHDAWVTALALAAAGAPFTLADGIALAERALEVWRSLTATLATAGVEMPALPPELVALTGGAL